MQHPRTINEVQIGFRFQNHKQQFGTVTKKTKTSITVTFDNGDKITNRYRHEQELFFIHHFVM